MPMPQWRSGEKPANPHYYAEMKRQYARFALSPTVRLEHPEYPLPMRFQISAVPYGGKRGPDHHLVSFGEGVPDEDSTRVLVEASAAADGHLVFNTDVRLGQGAASVEDSLEFPDLQFPPTRGEEGAHGRAMRTAANLALTAAIAAQRQ